MMLMCRGMFFLLQPLIQPPHIPGLMRQQVLSLSEVAVASLLSSQQALRKPDRRNGLMVMMMGEFSRVLEKDGSAFLWAILKFVKCSYQCIITALYGSPGKIIRFVRLCFLGDPSATPPILHLFPWWSVSYSTYSYYCFRVFPWC